jgi:hypothetical protein
MKKDLMAVVLMGLVCGSGARARADLYGFSRITANTDGSVAAQLSLEVTQADSLVLFTFRNDGSVIWPNAFISRVYFDDGADVLASPWVISDKLPGVDFEYTARGNLPGGNTMTPKFTSDYAFAFQGSRSGVHAWESLGISFTAMLADVLDAINHKGLRVGIHVQGLNGRSDTFTTATPLPGAALLGMLGVAVAGWRLRKVV